MKKTKFIDKYQRVLMGGFAFATLVLALLSLTLAGQLVAVHNKLENKPEDLTVEGQAEFNAQEQEAYISSLESENETLTNRVDELVEASQSEGEETVVIDENEALRNDVREMTAEFTKQFFNRSNETDETRRDRLEPYVDETILNAFAPEDEPYLDLVSQFDPEVKIDSDEDSNYVVSLEEVDIYLNEESLDSDLIDVYVVAKTEMTINDYESTKDDYYVNLKIEKNSDDLVVTNIHFNYSEPETY